MLTEKVLPFMSQFILKSQDTRDLFGCFNAEFGCHSNTTESSPTTGTEATPDDQVAIQTRERFERDAKKDYLHHTPKALSALSALSQSMSFLADLHPLAS